MSTPAPVLVPGVATLTVAPNTPLPAANGAQASITVVVTDSAGTVYPVVTLNGTETPAPWSYAATFASGAASAVATAMDVNGAVIGAPATYTFTVTPVGVPTTFNAPSGFGFVANAVTPAVPSIQGQIRK